MLSDAEVTQPDPFPHGQLTFPRRFFSPFQMLPIFPAINKCPPFPRFLHCVTFLMNSAGALAFFMLFTCRGRRFSTSYLSSPGPRHFGKRIMAISVAVAFLRASSSPGKSGKAERKGRRTAFPGPGRGAGVALGFFLFASDLIYVSAVITPTYSDFPAGFSSPAVDNLLI